MPIIRRTRPCTTAYGVLHWFVMAVVVWSCVHFNLHTVHTAAHNHSQHNQCRTPHALGHGLILLMIGIMMPETYWDRSLIINIGLVSSCGACGVLHWLCWLWLCGAVCTVWRLQCTQLHTTTAITNQCRTPYAVVHGLVLLMMGIMMPETCWDRSLIINIELVASFWFLSLHISRWCLRYTLIILL